MLFWTRFGCLLHSIFLVAVLSLNDVFRLIRAEFYSDWNLYCADFSHNCSKRSAQDGGYFSEPLRNLRMYMDWLHSDYSYSWCRKNEGHIARLKDCDRIVQRVSAHLLKVLNHFNSSEFKACFAISSPPSKYSLCLSVCLFVVCLCPIVASLWNPFFLLIRQCFVVYAWIYLFFFVSWIFNSRRWSLKTHYSFVFSRYTRFSARKWIFSVFLRTRVETFGVTTALLSAFSFFPNMFALSTRLSIDSIFSWHLRFIEIFSLERFLPNRGLLIPPWLVFLFPTFYEY